MNPDVAINEVARVIKSDGFLVLSTPNLASWINRLLLLLGMQPLFSEVSTVGSFGRRRKQWSFPVGHLRLFTHEALEEFLTYYRIKIIKVEVSPFENLPQVLNKINRIFSKIPSVIFYYYRDCMQNVGDRAQSLNLVLSHLERNVFYFSTGFRVE